MKQTYPNKDGIYRSQKQGVIVTISRESIIVETIEQVPEIVDVDNKLQQTPSSKKRDLINETHKGIQFINDIFWGKEKQ